MPTPGPTFAEMTLPAPGSVPPMTLSCAPMSITTPAELPMAAVLRASVPMKFPWTRTPVAVEPTTNTPSSALAEMTLRAPAVVPPIVVPGAPPMRIPVSELPKGVVPVAARPT
jgi:hypothetical protein